MLWTHPSRPAERLRLAYCLNLHRAGDLEACLAALSGYVLPLRERLGARGPFGVGMYLPAELALHLDSPEGAEELERLLRFLREHELDPFTWNAFPYGGFHAAGLKEGVFQPRWSEPARLEYTLAVARIAARAKGADAEGHVSISTHPGRYGAFGDGEWAATGAAWLKCAREFARLEEEGGPRIVLSIEPEPGASSGSMRELAQRLESFARSLDERQRAMAQRHVGTCFDTCHAAVEYEDAAEAYGLVTAAGRSLGKLQFSSALALERPGEREGARAQLLSLDEDRYLHQVRGLAADGGVLRAKDLPELARALEVPGSPWLACEEWRCHFHVPVDLPTLGKGLKTTRSEAWAALETALARPETWPAHELHLEIETYTWDVLPGVARGAGETLDGLEREVRYVAGLLARAGWSAEVPGA